MGWGTGSRPTNVVRAKNSSTVLSSTPLAEDEEGRAVLIGLFRGVDRVFRGVNRLFRGVDRVFIGVNRLFLTRGRPAHLFHLRYKEP